MIPIDAYFFSYTHICSMSEPLTEPLTVFNPFDLYVGARYHEPVQVQEIIDYCADRFRAVLNYMRDRYKNADIPRWFNRTFEGELVCSV